MIRNLIDDLGIIGLALLLFLLCFLLFLIDGIFAQPESFQGKVIDKHYKAESSSVGGGLISSSGNQGTVIIIETDPEEFIIMVLTSKKVVTVKCEPELYYNKKIGDSIHYNVYKGLLTGIDWSFEGTR